ncbi:HAD-IA family hydrolase [Polycladidibacter stylochi]|uniref:HAD-IA family hydrolase n=1 Tax=Polycladidibacter stylochi TaxID=1807766 RepID=UPI0008308E3A|nr:HAD-IA family hydrolase [Pseudovibrio stylochi]
MYKDFLERVCQNYDVLALGSMGVIYNCADDLEEIIIPFLKVNQPEIDINNFLIQYFRASIGEITTSELLENTQLSPQNVEAFLNQYKLSCGLQELLVIAAQKFQMICCFANDIEEWSQQRAFSEHLTILDHRLVSSTLKYRKPSVNFYEKATEIIDTSPNRILLVDDRPENLDSAHRLGFGTIWLSPNADTDVAHPRISSLHDLVDSLSLCERRLEFSH